MKTEDNDLYEAVSAAYEKHKGAAEVDPAWLATLAMVEIGFARDLHERGYRGCHLYLRQLARRFCATKFDPADTSENDLFPETLQQRYPRAHKDAAEQPVYALLDLLTDADVEYNVTRLRKEAQAKLRHADALEAWGRNRRSAA